MHLHHILPRHAGGTDDESNLYPLSVTQHALAHRNRWILTGDIKDRIAWLTLSGQISIDDATIAAMRKANLGKKRYLTGKGQTTVTCPHCKTSGGQVVMNRWHMENCKYAQ